MDSGVQVPPAKATSRAVLMHNRRRCSLSTGNGMCGLRTYRPAIAAALPHVQLLDGRNLATQRGAAATPGGAKGASALQHLAAMQLQAFSQVAFAHIT